MRKYFDVVGEDYTVDGGSADSKPFINVKLLITKGDHAGESRYARLYLTEASAEYTLKAMKALGWKGPELDNREGFGSILATAVEDDESWTQQDGTVKTSRKIKYINEFKPRAMKAKNEAPPNFLAQFKALASQIAGPGVKVAAPDLSTIERKVPGAPKVEKTEPDSDIPF